MITNYLFTYFILTELCHVTLFGRPISDKLNDLQPQLKERDDRLGEASDLQKFLQSLDHFQQWLTKTQTAIACDDIPSNLTEAEEMLEAHEAIFDEMNGSLILYSIHFCTLYSVLYTLMYSILCTLYTSVLYTLYCILCTLYSVLYTHLYSIFYTLYSVLYTLRYSILCTVYSVLYTLYCILCTLYSVLYTLLYSIFYTLYSVLLHLCTLYSVLYTLYSILCTLYTSLLYILYSILCTLYTYVLYTLYCILCTVYSVLYTLLYSVLYIVGITKLIFIRQSLPYQHYNITISHYQTAYTNEYEEMKIYGAKVITEGKKDDNHMFFNQVCSHPLVYCKKFVIQQTLVFLYVN